jgi:pyruvate dehydrogenase E2 component (dihydrolipoamide acetyltransferase)
MPAATQQIDYVMPSLGADMDEGSVIEWQVAVGDRVARGDVVARVETDKSDIDIEIWIDGEVREILVPPGRLVAVGTPLLRLATDDSAPAHAAPADEAVADDAGTTAAVRAPSGRPSGLAPRGDGLWATPLARRVAGEQGVDLSAVVGSGPNGAIRMQDLPSLATLPVAPDAPDEVRPLTRADRMRRTIADRMSQSNRDIPHYFLERQIDLSALIEHLGALNAELEMADRVVPAAAFIRATALAAARHGELNGHWSDGVFVAGTAVNVAVAVSLRGGGLVTPQIQQADTVGLAATMAQLKAMTMEARSGVLRSTSLGGGSADTVTQMSTITVTNLGERGADLVYGLISPPEVALVGFGRISRRPWVVDGEVRPCDMVTGTLAADHRATDGATGSRFLATIARLLEHPEEL